MGKLTGRATAVVAVSAGLLLVGVGVAQAAVVEPLVPLAQAALGNGWAVHPDQTAGGRERFVEGPATPPSGRGSLEMTVDTTSDRSLIFTVPSPGTVTPAPWAGLTAKYSTFTFDSADGNLPTLRIVGYHVFPAAGGGAPSGFTTLTFVGGFFAGGAPNGPHIAGQWQTWTLSPTSTVFQSNTTDAGFCVQAAPCTLAQFAARYSGGAWFQVQLGIGSGAAAGSLGFVDAVSISQGGTEVLNTDFEIPAASSSTATITPGAATATGGTATVTLNASPLAAAPVVFDVVTTAPDGTVTTTPVEVAPGESVTVPLSVLFGSTTITVSAQGVVLATQAVVFPAPVTPTPTPTPTPPGASTSAPLPATGSPELAATGASTGPYAWIALALMALGALGVATSRRHAEPARGKIER